MKRGASAGPVVLVLGGVVPADAASARYRLDPEHVSIAFKGMSIGHAAVSGLLASARGSSVLEETSRALEDRVVESEAEAIRE